MKISYNWLKEFVDIKVNPQKLADDLSLFGHEVESITKTNGDYILDFKITPNRGDCLSIIGMAREVAALYDKKVKIPNIEIYYQKINKKIDVNISDRKICTRFTARVIDNIKITESPEWIKKKLKLYGFRPINTIVDITNYVMIETGQPLHAFDYHKISSGVMNISLSKDGDSLRTLDGKCRQLDKQTIVIKDNQKVYDLAGIMGGASSEVDNNTKTIVLQGSVFSPVYIRSGSKKNKLITDASYRFERGVDPQGTVYAVDRATQIIKKICPNSVVGEMTDTRTNNKKTQIKIDIKRINSLLGTKLSLEQITSYLVRLNIIYRREVAEIPSYRMYDIKIWQDVAEEVARIYGYSKLGRGNISKEKSSPNKYFINKEHIKDILVENGFTEVYSYSFADKKLIDLLNEHFKDNDLIYCNLKNCRSVTNSMDSQNKYLRPNIATSLITAVAKNPWAPETDLFEIGKVYNKGGEKWQVGIATTRKNGERILQDIINQFNVSSKTIQEIIVDHPEYKIRKKPFFAVFDLNNANIVANKYNLVFPNIQYKSISELPPTIRDLAFIVDRRINSQEVAEQIKTLDKHILLTELFDEFASDKFGKNKKNVAYHVWLQDMNHPMNDREVNKITQKIINKIQTKYRAQLRS